ncbi:MAG: hypothetical protein LBJ35_00770 [Spirochaetaceae bacterium]|nr:hypothetical protein [Spirochaetaceae bacterium]
MLLVFVEIKTIFPKIEVRRNIENRDFLYITPGVIRRGITYRITNYLGGGGAILL